jgi:hypothetical protein
MKKFSIKTIWLQIDDETRYNSRYWWSLKDMARKYGYHLGIWASHITPSGASIDVWNFSPSSYVLEAERHQDYDKFALALSEYDKLPKAVVTNFAPFTNRDGTPNDRSRLLIEAGWACLTECDIPNNPNATPARMDWEARQRGWSYGQPVVYVNSSCPLDYYTPLLSTGFPGWSIWSAEYLIGV